MKKILIVAAIVLPLASSAQSVDSRQEFMQRQREAKSQYIETSKAEYKEFISQRNEDFTKFIATQWEHYKLNNGEKSPEKPYPKEPIIKPQEEANIAPVKVPIKNIVTIPSIKPVAPQFRPVEPNDVPEEDIFPSPTPVEKRAFEFVFLGSELSVNLTPTYKFTLGNIGEQDVAKVWSDLSKSDLSTVVEECLQWKESLRLNDYLYVMMLDEMCTSFFGAAKHNEARLLKTYILTQSGYDAKCARTSSGLVMLLAIEETIYQKTYLTIDGTKYYIIDEPLGSDKQYYTFSQKFSDESKSCSVRIEEELVVNRDMTTTKTLTSKRYPSLTVDASVDRNLMELYNSYPRCKWDVYAKAPMSSDLSAKILPTLRAEIAGKSETEAADMILNFVQTAFEYKTDDDYFGYERSLFVDETFYYPYSDCEDRSILYANLMQNLLGLDVVLLYYPNHLATAVLFNSDYKGDYVIVSNKKYTICDPTYIGASIGVAMPQYKGVAADVVVL